MTATLIHRDVRARSLGRRGRALAWVALLLAAPAAALGADGFTLVNATGASIGAVEWRRTGESAWKPLGVSPAPGGQAAVAFSDPDCAFDLKGAIAGETVIWSGVNLCDVEAVILNRRGATAWVDYQ